VEYIKHGRVAIDVLYSVCGMYFAQLEVYLPTYPGRYWVIDNLKSAGLVVRLKLP